MKISIKDPIFWDAILSITTHIIIPLALIIAICLVLTKIYDRFASVRRSKRDIKKLGNQIVNLEHDMLQFSRRGIDVDVILNNHTSKFTFIVNSEFMNFDEFIAYSEDLERL